MGRYLRVNDLLSTTDGERVILALQPSHDIVELLTPGKRLIEQQSLQQLQRDIAIGDVKIFDKQTIKGNSTCASDSPAYNTFLFRLAVAKALTSKIAHGKTVTEAVKELKESQVELANGLIQPMCSLREAYRILKLYRLNETALIPAYSTRGNHKNRYDQRLTEVTLQLIENLYAQIHSKITIQKLTDLTNHVAKKEDIISTDTEVSRKFVRNVLIHQWNVDKDYKRLDPRTSKSAKAVASNRIKVGAPLHRVEMDTLHLPFIAKSSLGLVDNLHVILAIDCETSMPLSWWLITTKPTTEDTLQCIERAIYPKNDTFKKMSIKSEVDPYGTMLNLILDNGPENSRHRLANLAEVGINLNWVEANAGHRKPFIERLNGSLKRALEVLPGCTRFKNKDGVRTEAALNDSLLTFEELEHWIVKWLFERWPHTRLDRFVTADYSLVEELGITPSERWKNYEKKLLLPISPPLEKWRSLRFVHVERTISHKTGISLHGFDFRGDNLRSLINQFGVGAKVNVLYNPFDYRTVYVRDKSKQELIMLVNSEVTSSTPAFPFDTAKERRNTVKSSYKNHPIAQQFDTDINELVLTQDNKSKSKRANQKEHKKNTRVNEAIARAKNNPLEPTQERAADFVDSYISNDAIPTFDTHNKPGRTPRK